MLFFPPRPAFQQQCVIFALFLPILVSSSFLPFKSRDLPELPNFSCANVTDIQSVRAIFELYRIKDPNLSLENVNGSAGRPFRDKMMECTDFCLLPFGSGNADITGIGVLISYVLQIVLTLSLGPIHSLASWMQRTNFHLHPVIYKIVWRLIPSENAPGIQQSRARRLVFTSFYDTSLLVTTSLGIACLTTSTEDVGLYQLAYLRYIAEISFGSLVVTYTLIGKHSRRPGARLLASLPALALFVAIEMVSIPKAEYIISHDILPFYETLGIDCVRTGAQIQEVKNSIVPRETLHRFALIGFAIFIFYFLLSRIHVIYRRQFTGPGIFQPLRDIWNDCTDLKGFLGGIRIYIILWVIKMLVHFTIYGVAILEICRLIHLRNTFRSWYKSNEQPWSDDDWGFGQILAVFVWGSVFWEAGLSIFEALRGVN